ncbi:rRNA maturation RNase YbeY [Limosilactobacillus ingluviei]|uniref:rRNA maturation RNase YbeY n=1 Tax=Limosilactobacillus ingluviei TaxID=148604 RepID=UPI0002E5DA30|nr:rRNA maturation RNase YbeY [Limosilactobacillus ingluviei]MBM6729236.1 rRNA maturation RNase YbeY [Limosilactobacillus ingluviei]HJG49150.1 rRNA maturation RNase YbeY [Limosilactobacillus ingluviei]
MELTIYDHSQGMLTEHQTALAEELLAQAAAKLALPASAELSLTLVRNPEMKELNAKYRGVDRATDVISFAINDEEDLTLPAELQAELPLDLGDLFISLDKVKEQALFLGHSADREFGFLLVHGFLHLNGYDHETPADEAAMFSLQEAILTAYGLTR